MLIRNYRNLTELENKRRKQQELLNIAIDNERINEERISNYQNPNKPPPVPPQYKSGAEITKDLELQERTGIQNLESIGVDLPTATNVVNNLRLSNIDYLVKLNRNFPFIKRNITDKFNVKLLNSATILAYLDSVFNDIDENFGLSSKGQESLVAKTGREFVSIIPTNEQISELYDTLQDINTTIGGYVFDNTGYTTLLNYLDLLEKTLPTETELKSIDLLPVNERNSILRKLSSLVSTFRVPSGGTIKQLHSNLVEEINDAVGEEQAGGAPDYEVIEKTIDLISRNIGGIGEEGFRKINEVKNSIKKSNEVSGFKGRIVEQEADLPEKEYIVEEDLVSDTPEQILREKRIMNYVEGRLKDNMFRMREVKERYTLPPYNDYNGIPRLSDGTVIYERLFERGPRGGLKEISMETVGKTYKNFSKPKFDLEGNLIDYNKYLLKAEATIDTNGNVLKQDTYQRFDKVPQYKQNIREIEYPIIVSKIKTNATYDPQANEDDREFLTHGFGVKKKKGEFNPNRIKIGKGISVEEEPRYKTFGKYVIHNQQLTNDGVLNVKYPSLGPVPSIKPAKISETYKDFVIDVIENGRPNERLFKNLTQNEKEHFEKISRGAGLIGKFKSSVNIEVDDKKDVDRFNVLKGEFDAGNNNDKMIKELRALTVKFINNNKIKRGEGMDLLLELSKI
jgi:hypothetical protein